MEMFNKGDKFIHYTKHGGVNIGEVEDIHVVHCHDLKNTCVYLSYSIFTTKGVRLSLDGSDGKIFKIIQNLTRERADSIDRGLRIVRDRKFRPNKDLIHKVNEDKKT